MHKTWQRSVYINWVNMGKGIGMCKKTDTWEDKRRYYGPMDSREVDQLRWQGGLVAEFFLVDLDDLFCHY